MAQGPQDPNADRTVRARVDSDTFDPTRKPDQLEIIDTLIYDPGEDSPVGSPALSVKASIMSWRLVAKASSTMMS